MYVKYIVTCHGRQTVRFLLRFFYSPCLETLVRHVKVPWAAATVSVWLQLPWYILLETHTSFIHWWMVSLYHFPSVLELFIIHIYILPVQRHVQGVHGRGEDREDRTGPPQGFYIPSVLQLFCPIYFSTAPFFNFIYQCCNELRVSDLFGAVPVFCQILIRFRISRVGSGLM